MIWDHNNPEKVAVLYVEQNKTFGVCSCEECGVGVDANGLVPGEAVLVQVQVDLVQPGPRVGVHVDVSAAGGLGRTLIRNCEQVLKECKSRKTTYLHHTDLLFSIYKQLIVGGV